MTPDQQQIARMNRHLAEKMGYAQNGGPAFKIMRTRDLDQLPLRETYQTVSLPGSVLAAVTSTRESRPQWSGPQTWCIAQWIAPPSKVFWEADPKTSMFAYPRNGYWFMTMPIEKIEAVTEDWIQWLSDQMNWKREMPLSEALDRSRRAADKREEDSKKIVADAVRDCFVNHIPGNKGVVSYPSHGRNV